MTFALCAAPLAFGAAEPWAWPVLALLTLAAVISWAVACLRLGEVRIFWTPLYGFGALLLAVGMVQYFAGATPDRIAMRDALILLATDLLLFFLAGQLFAGQSAETLEHFGAVVTVYGSGLALFAILQSLSNNGLIYWCVRPPAKEFFGPYVNRNNYAGLMEMLVPVAAAYAFTRRAGDPRRLLSIFAVVIAVASLWLSGSRGGMAALLMESGIFTFIALRSKLIGRRPYAVTGMGLVLVTGLALSIWANPGFISARMMSISRLPTQPQLTLGQRLIASRDALNIARYHPWFGAGLGSFQFAFPHYQSFPSNDIWEHAHDDYAEALAETGLIGGLLLLAALIVFLYTAFRNLAERLWPPSRWIRLGSAVGCCGLLVHGFVDFNLHIPANAAWFALCASLAIAPVAAPPQATGSQVNGKWQ